MSGPIQLQGLTRPSEVDLMPRRSIQGTAPARESFADALGRAVGSVDQSMKASEQNIQAFAAGKIENVHEVMISMQKAQLSFQLMVEIRNKALETYQEISRMQI